MAAEAPTVLVKGVLVTRRWSRRGREARRTTRTRRRRRKSWRRRVALTLTLTVTLTLTLTLTITLTRQTPLGAAFDGLQAVAKYVEEALQEYAGTTDRKLGK